MTSEKILDISWATILKIFIAVVCFYVLYQIHYILVWFIFALIISTLFAPIVDFLTKLRIPRILAVFFIYLFGIFGILSLMIYLTADLLITEFYALTQAIPHFPYFFEQITPFLEELGIKAFESPEAFMTDLREMTDGIFSALFTIFGGIFAFIFILTISFFLSLEKKGIERVLLLLSPKKDEAYILSLWSRCQNQISGWFFTRILGCLFIGLACCIVFLLFNVPYSFSLSLLAGVSNFIPYIGPLIAGVIIFIIIALENLSLAIFALIIFILIQQIENNIIMPVLTKKFIGLPPVLVLLALVIGGILWGFLGAILAIPLVGILFEFSKEYLLHKKKKEEKAVIL